MARHGPHGALSSKRSRHSGTAGVSDKTMFEDIVTHALAGRWGAPFKESKHQSMLIRAIDEQELLRGDLGGREIE
ncbi:hypothetical protein J6590_045145 [Homalodisca vitripennis]|nr:hypothetical protein J6590_045145 [Homalodisca vitripennis]